MTPAEELAQQLAIAKILREAVPPSSARPAPPKAPEPQRGVWDWMHPEGIGVTKRGFNDIYPKP